MTKEPSRRRGGQTKSAGERKRNNLTFRARDALKADLEKTAKAANRSLSEQIEYMLGRAFEWERVLGDLETFKQHLAQSKERMEQAERETVQASLYRKGWGKLHDPAAPGGVWWFPPGTHNIPQSGFEPWDAPPPTAAPLPPAILDAVQNAVREILEQAGLAAKKKSGGEAA